MLYRPYPDEIAEMFDRFWRTAPRRQGGKLEAERAYREALNHAAADELQRGMEQYARHVMKNKIAEQFQVTPTTFCKRGMWADEYVDKVDTRAAYKPYIRMADRKESA